MRPYSMSEEKRVFNSLRRLFGKLIMKIKEGEVTRDGIAEEARKFIESPQVDAYLRNLITKMTARFRIDTARDWKKAAMTF